MISEETKLRLEGIFSALPPDKKIIFLSALSLELTICARGFYPDQETEEDNLPKLICLNETQHTVTGQLAKMVNNDVERYPDNVFLEVVLEKASNGFCEKGLLTSLKFSFKRVGISLDDL